MPIFIAKTYEGKVESVVLAKNYELAQAYWQGQNVSAHAVTTFTEDNLKNHPTGVIPIINTEIRQFSEFGSDAKKYLVIK